MASLAARDYSLFSPMMSLKRSTADPASLALVFGEPCQKIVC